MNNIPRLFSFFLVICALCVCVFGAGVSSALAQGLGINNTTTIRKEPLYPAPGAAVTLTLITYEGDINNATVSWFADGVVIQRGRGLKSVAYTMPAAGKSAEITVIAEITGGGRISHAITLRAHEVVVIANADTRTPPLYKGRAMPTLGSDVVLSAMPALYTSAGTSLDPALLTYEWWSDGGNFEGATKGAGLRTITLHNPYFAHDLRVAVTVTDPSSGMSAQGSVIIPEKEPRVLLYEHHPIWGTWYNAVVPQAFSLNKAEIQIVAEPYYFSKQQTLAGLIYEWLTPGIAAPFRSSGNTLVFRPEGGREGQARVNLSVRNPATPERITAQSAKSTFTTYFGAEFQSNTSFNNEGLPVF